ncbi:MAG: tyrosine-protein phosphatase [Mucilaginibacter sp.]|nr:tyrosine-protein phosphatase [Mucilaginibacter sp.]
MKKYILLALIIFSTVNLFAQVADSAKRKVNLQGAVNFRDIGGYNTTDGHHVKWGKIYRSADMSKLTDADLAELKRRNITYDVDLRGHQESQQAPDKLNSNTDYILCPAGSDSLTNLMKDIAKYKTSGDSIITSFYSNTTYLTDRYKPFFNKLLLLPDNQSLVFHCTAGKDRTGIGAALFLYALGVPYDTIVSDYMASDYYRLAENKKSLDAMVQIMHINENVAKDMLSVKKQYLDAAIAAINKQYGSVDNFLRMQIGLDDQKIALLKKKFLD